MFMQQLHVEMNWVQIGCQRRDSARVSVLWLQVRLHWWYKSDCFWLERMTFIMTLESIVQYIYIWNVRFTLLSHMHTQCLLTYITFVWRQYNAYKTIKTAILTYVSLSFCWIYILHVQYSAHSFNIGIRVHKEISHCTGEYSDSEWNEYTILVINLPFKWTFAVESCEQSTQSWQ